MRTLYFFLISFLMSAPLMGQRTFYISNQGSDTAGGQIPEEAWQSLQKVNLEMEQFQAGDKILFRRGDTFPGGLSITVSGRPEQPIVFGAYGKGKDPVFTGAYPVKGWKKGNKGIYSVPFSTEVYWLFSGGTFLTPARYPNSGFLRFPESSPGKFNNQFKDASGKPDGYWIESMVHLRGHRFVYQERNVMSHHDSTVVLWGSVYSPIKGFGYFFDRHLLELDSLSEWHYDPQASLLYYLPEKESDLEKTLAVTQQNCFLVRGDYLQFEHLQFEYFARHAIKGDYRNNIDIRNCSFKHINDRAIDVSKGKNWTIENNRFEDILNSAIRTGDCESFIVKNNYINRIALQQGLFRFPFGNAIYVGGRFSKNNYFGYNTIDSIGRQGFYVNGEGHVIEKNIITNTVMLSDDDGAINLYGDGGVIAKDIIIRNNYIENTFGELESVDTWYTWQKNTMDVGIYTDDRSHNIIIEGNTIINSNTGVLMHNNQHVVLKDNTIFKAREIGVDVRNDWLINDWEFMKDNRLEGNVIYVESQEAHPLQIFDEKDNWRRFASYENNHLVHPFGKEVILRKWVDNDYSTYKGQNAEFSMPEWKDLQKSKKNVLQSKGTPDFIKNSSQFEALIVSNPSDEVLKKDLEGPAKSKYYNLNGQLLNSIELKPWRSKILIKVIQ